MKYSHKSDDDWDDNDADHKAIIILVNEWI